MSETQTLETSERATSARGLGTGAVLAAGFAAAGLLSAARPARAVSPPLTFSDVPGSGDFKVLNFALILEELEAELYVQAIQRLTGGGNGGSDAAPGVNIPGLGLSTAALSTRAHVGNTADLLYYQQFGQIEVEHRNFLRAALGNNAVPANRFKYDFEMGTKSRREVLDLVLTAERTGVGAYLGAITRFATRTFVQTAAAIQGTEARHTTTLILVNNILASNGTLPGQVMSVAPLANENNGRDLPIDPNEVLQRVSPFIVVNQQ